MNLPPVLRQRYLDSAGAPLVNGKLFTYQAGTTTPQATYTDAGGLTPNTNPIILNSNGEAAMWLNPALSYKFVLKNSSDVTQWTTDGVVGSLTTDSVTTAAIIDQAITSAKIADGAVGFLKLASNVFGPSTQVNCSLTASVAASAMLVTLKTLAGGVPTVLDPVRMGFRSSTLTSGLALLRDVTSAITLTVPSGATLGTLSAIEQSIYILAIDNAGTVELAVVGSRFDLDEGSLISTTALSSSSDDISTIYSNNARTNVPFRVLGRIKSTQATAGAWITAPSEISLATSGRETWNGRQDLAQQVSSSCGVFTTASTSYVAVTNLSVTLKTYGRPVELALQSDGTDTGSVLTMGILLTGTNASATMKFLRDSTDVSIFAFINLSPVTTQVFRGSVAIDTPPAGTYTYSVQIKYSVGGLNDVRVQNMVLVAYELGT